MRYRIEFFRDAAGDWRWRVRHRNGRSVAVGGEGYRRRIDAQRALTRLLDADPVDFRLAPLSPSGKRGTGRRRAV